MPIEPCLYPGKPDRVVEAALATLGLDYSFLARQSGADPEWIRQRLASKELWASEWIAICNALYLNVGCISYGYFRREHKANIRWALRKRYFKLPKTHSFWRIRIELWMDLLRSLKWQRQYYGFRLRWKARYQDLNAFLKDRSDGKKLQYDPLEGLRMVFHHEEATVLKGLTTQIKRPSARGAEKHPI